MVDIRDEIKIGFEMDDIEKKSSDEKLNLLLRIAFLNHKSLAVHSKTLYGNGEPGICEVVRSQSRGMRWLWGIISTAGSGGSIVAGAGGSITVQ